MIYEIRYTDETVASAFVEADSPEAAERAFEEMAASDPGWLRDNFARRTGGACNFAVVRVEGEGREVDPAGMLAAFNAWKERIDEAHDAGEALAREDLAYNMGEDLILARHPAVAALAQARGDTFDTSPEIAALGFAMDELGYL